MCVLSYVYSKQPILGLTQEWFRELSFSRLECGVHDKLHISVVICPTRTDIINSSVQCIMSSCSSFRSSAR